MRRASTIAPFAPSTQSFVGDAVIHRTGGAMTPIKPNTPLLDRVAGPSDLRQMPDEDLAALADELRAEVISAVSETGGHLGSGLGVVELSVAIHAVFNTPMDKLIWDVGHQCYPHKILTGRRDRIRTLRQKDGLVGFHQTLGKPV